MEELEIKAQSTNAETPKSDEQITLSQSSGDADTEIESVQFTPQ